MENVTPWIEHLNKPLVLTGFVLFVLAGLVKLFKPEKLNSKATERLMNRAMVLSFILGFLIVLLAFVRSFMYMQTVPPVTTVISPSTVNQNTTGKQSPAINNVGDVNVNFGENPLPQQEKGISDSPPAELPPSVQQQTQGEQSPVINSSGDVNIQY